MEYRGVIETQILTHHEIVLTKEENQKLLAILTKTMGPHSAPPKDEVITTMELTSTHGAQWRFKVTVAKEEHAATTTETK